MNEKTYTLIGTGIMSATLGVFLNELMPNTKVVHSSLCNLIYTPKLEDGHIDLRKALKTSESFEVSTKFWIYFKKIGNLNLKQAFIVNIDHITFIWGNKNVELLRKTRKYTTDFLKLEE